jgi:thioredoxin 1
MRHILYFTADWCNPCKRTRPIVDELNRDSGDVKFQIIDVDSELEMAKSFNVSSIPTFVVIENGSESNRATGAQTKDQLEALMFNEF